MRWLAFMMAGPVLTALAVPTASARDRGPARFFPDPSSIFAADIAFSRMAREQGQWTAFRKTAAEDAVIAVERRELAQQWLKNKKDPPQVVKWQAQRAYVSCDGRLGASTGGWQGPDGAQGYFTTIWQRNKKGEWKWIFDHWDRLATPRETTDILEGHVASCKGLKGPPGPGAVDDGASAPLPLAAPPQGRAGRQQRKKDNAPPPVDDSLRWSYDITADGGRTVRVSLWNGSAYDVVIDDVVAAPR